MKRTHTLWVFPVLTVTGLNAWAAYQVAVHAYSMTPADATPIVLVVGVATFMLAWIIVSL